MPDQRSATCPTCGKRITLNQNGVFRPHGHPARRCKSSGEAPPLSIKITVTEPQGPTHGICSHCRAGKRLKKDGAMPRHLDYRRGREIQQGWCLGSDKPPMEA